MRVLVKRMLWGVVPSVVVVVAAVLATNGTWYDVDDDIAAVAAAAPSGVLAAMPHTIPIAFV